MVTKKELENSPEYWKEKYENEKWRSEKRITELEEAIKPILDHIENWLDTGEVATKEESNMLYENLKSGYKKNEN